MNRDDLQKLADMRLSDANTLLASTENDAGAYYLAGYAVECALKAVITKVWYAKLQNAGEYPYPDFADTSFKKENYYSHRIKELLKLADLEPSLKDHRNRSTQLDENWKVVEEWKEDARYTVFRSRQDAEDMVKSVEDPTEGVLQ